MRFNENAKTIDSTRSRRRQSGFVLVIALWVIVVLSTTAFAYIRHVTLEMNMAAFQRDVAVVENVARAGMQQALILLREDMIKDQGENFRERMTRFRDQDSYRYDSGAEAWSYNPDLYEDVPFYVRNEQVGYYFATVRDESAKFPINNPATTVDMIARLLELTGVDEDEARSLAGAIIDWRDPDNIVTDVGGRTFGRDAADEMTFYNSGHGQRRSSRQRNNEMPLYVMKNAPFDSVDELLMVPGMRPEIVYGNVDPEEASTGLRGRRMRLRRGEYLGLTQFVTVYSNTSNLNTVKREVLDALLVEFIGEQAERMASDWVDYRNGRDRMPYTDQDRALKTYDNSDLDDVHYTEVSGFTDELMQQMRDLLRIETDFFEIVTLADYRGVQKGFRAIVERDYIPWYTLPEFGIDTDRPEDMEQVILNVHLYEPVFDAMERIQRML